MRVKLCLLLLILTFLMPASIYAEEIQKKKLAIVIDDFGNNMKGTDEILGLPVNLTIAVMPFMPSTKEDAEKAYDNGHEVIVHMPMEPKAGKRSWLGPGAITSDLSNAEIRKRTEEAIRNVPHAVGMNNHMGSKITEDERAMRIILNVCKEQGLYYLDSKTSGKSVIGKLANEIGVPVLENNIFFDDMYTMSHVTKQANLVAKNLLNNEQFIAIGHVGVPGPTTSTVLKKYIPVYKERANIVSLSKLIPGFEWVD
ncbi:divergent polysaccharide deacetylase family protein [Aciduricibacillus chroicocephali]|uniref:Divergent polysaccharide deacetylase family protein n=1 Tax=Aciduricibacillus chroicocephali TaxID=3054939 RepID=A0ABY9KW33_9BACI|nr:divergent polysaccharide deacetylase family protein [Bacillaceae bacterium 44XB]